MRNIKSELRVGNWLQGSEGYFKLTHQTFAALLNDKIFGKYNPIIINEKVLEETSFEKTNTTISKNSVEGVMYSYLNYTYTTVLFDLDIYNSEEEISGGGSNPLLTVNNVIYLHQLQNLIFALEEMEMKVFLTDKGVYCT